MTEEQQGGTTPEPEAIASVADQASEDTVTAVAVADEPATSPDDRDPVAAEAPTRRASRERAPDAERRQLNLRRSGAEPAPPRESPPEPGADPGRRGAALAEPTDALSARRDRGRAGRRATREEEPAPPRQLGPEPTTMEELLAEQDSDIKSFKHGDVVEGQVVRIDKDEILVDIGAKSEGVVSNRELFGRHGEGQPELAIGDTVLVYVLQPESPEGHVVLSLRRAGLERKWRAMQEQFEAGVIIEAPVIDHNKGGLIVDCGIRGFVPISQIVDFPRRPQNDQPRDAAQEIAEKLHAVRRP